MADLGEVDQVEEPAERVIETLQLFPLNSIGEFSEAEKVRAQANKYGEDDDSTMFQSPMGEHMDKPALDLRLSFL